MGEKEKLQPNGQHVSLWEIGLTKSRLKHAISLAHTTHIQY